MLTFRIKKANPSIQHRLSKEVKQQMHKSIEQFRLFANGHLQMLQQTRKVFKRFALQKDKYMATCNFVVKSLVKFETNHLEDFAHEQQDLNDSILVKQKNLHIRQEQQLMLTKYLNPF